MKSVRSDGGLIVVKLEEIWLNMNSTYRQLMRIRQCEAATASLPLGKAFLELEHLILKGADLFGDKHEIGITVAALASTIGELKKLTS